MSNHQSVPSSASLHDMPPPVDGERPVELLGDSSLMRRVREQIREAVARPGPTLLLAEPGFDTERVARHIHHIAGSTGPFIALDCADEEPAALERRLFGDASVLRAVRRGTLYLARVTDMRAAAQARLARALRDGDVQLDGGRVVSVGMRVVVASAAPNVEEDVEDGRLRADLYRRLAGGRIQIPTLRERPADIGAIAAHLARPRTLTHAALASLAALPWAGNIAELRARISRLCAASDHRPIRAEDVLTEIRLDRRSGAAQPGTLRDARRHFEREYIAAVLSRHGWRISEAAATLGLERANLYRKIRQVGLSRPTAGGRRDR